MGHHDPARPRSLRTVPHRLPPPRRGAHRALQLPLRTQARRRLRAAHRRHRPLAFDRRGHRPDPALAARDGARLGRGSREARHPWSLSPDRAPADLPRAHRAPARRGPPLHLLPHARGARGRAQRRAGREARLGLQRRLPRPAGRRGRPAQGGRRALDPALSRASRHDRVRRPAARPGRGGQRDHRRLHRAALRRHHHLQPGGGRRRRHDGREPRHPRRRPPLQHAQADPDLRGPGGAAAALPAHAAALRHRPQEALQAARRHQPRAARGHGLPRRGGAQLPVLPVDRVRRVDDPVEPRRPHRALRRREPGHERQHLRPRETALDERALHPRPGHRRARGARACLPRARRLLRAAVGAAPAGRTGRRSLWPRRPTWASSCRCRPATSRST